MLETVESNSVDAKNKILGHFNIDNGRRNISGFIRTVFYIRITLSKISIEEIFL